MSGLLGGSKTTTQKTTPYNGEYKTWVKDMYGSLSDSYNNTADDTYSGQVATGTTAAQDKAISSLSGLLDNSALQDTMNGKYLDVESNPYMAGYANKIKSDIADTWGKTSDSINANYNKNGLYYGSARNDQLNTQQNNLAEQESNALNNLYGGAYSAERTNQMNALGNYANYSNSLMNAGTTQQQTNQTALDKEYQAWLDSQNLANTDTGNMLSLLSLVKNPTTTQTSSGGGLGSLLGSVAGIGLGNSNFGKNWF